MNGDHWREQARASGLPSFPIRIERDAAGKWLKRPLTKHGHLDATFQVDRFGGLWDHANGYGTRMGEVATGVGYYTIDVDDPAPGAPPDVWLQKRHVPLDTRTVRTPSGGRHLIFMLPGKFSRLRSRQSIVPGMDSRGEGGWSAFGAHYSVEVDAPPTLLPSAVCAELQAGWKGGGGLGATGTPVELPKLQPVDARRVRRKLDKILWGDHATRALRQTWGGTREKGDTSRSGNDHALAHHLALYSFEPSEIIHIILNEFRHGVAARDGVDARSIRAAGRSAAKATTYAEALRASPKRPSEQEIEEYLATLAEGGT